ncbi:MAG: DUF6110 family protein [Lachnospiraceae bacterium]|nr:DUF6110 family protein [Lachnospiraceae bacterium]
MRLTEFVLGVAAGTIGIRLLTSREAKEIYSYVGAAGLHARDEVVRQGQIIKENCQDISARAKEINDAGRVREEECMIKNAPSGLDCKRDL